MTYWEIQKYDSGSSSWIEIDAQSFETTIGSLDPKLGLLKVTSNRSISLNSGQQIRIRDTNNSKTLFLGKLDRIEQSETGKWTLYVPIQHAVDVLGQEISLSLTDVTPLEVLVDAIENNTLYSVNAHGLSNPTGDTYNNYESTNTKIRSIIREVMNRSGFIVRADMSVKTFYFEEKGYRTSGYTFDEDQQAEDTKIIDWITEDRGKIINKVTVKGKDQSTQYSSTATDQTSIDNYGENPHPNNPIYLESVKSDSQAQNEAQARLRPDPIDHGKFSTGKQHNTNLINESITLNSSAQKISSESFVVLEQKWSEPSGQAKIKVGYSDILEKNQEDQAEETDRYYLTDLDQYTEGQIYKQDKQPTSASDDDLWIETDTGILWRYDSGVSDWVKESDLTEEHADQINFIGSTAPSNPKPGWIWLDTSTSPDTLKKYNGSSWDVFATVQASWSGVYDDGSKPEDDATENQVFEQDTVPTGTQGDLWFDTGTDQYYECNQSTCDTLSDWTNTSDITSRNKGAWTYKEWLSKIDADHYFDGTFIVNGTIGANEIATGSITAEEIDVLNLDTVDLEIGADLSQEIHFEEFNTTGETVMIPESQDTCYLGHPDFPFNSYYGNSIHTDYIYSENNTNIQLLNKLEGDSELNLKTGTALGDDKSDYFEIVQSSALTGESALAPQTDLECNIGNSGARFWEMWADSFNSSSPKKFQGNPLRNLQEFEVNKKKKKDLPDYVVKKSYLETYKEKLESEHDKEFSEEEVWNRIREEEKQKIRKRKKKNQKKPGEKPDIEVTEEEIKKSLKGKDKQGMDLASMNAWLLEQNKEQQKRIEDLEERLEKLEEKIS